MLRVLITVYTVISVPGLSSCGGGSRFNFIRNNSMSISFYTSKILLLYEEYLVR